MATAKVCGRRGQSLAALHRFKAKYGGIDVSAAQGLRAFEGVTGTLKRLLAGAMRDIVVLRISSKNPDDTERAAGGPVEGDAGSADLTA